MIRRCNVSEDWRNRDLSMTKFKYLIYEGVYFETQVGRTTEKVLVLVLVVLLLSNYQQRPIYSQRD
jgi:hypothetical protein